MSMKTKDRENGTRGVPVLACAPQGTPAPEEQGAHAPVTGYPGNVLKTKALQSQFTHRQSSFANALALGSLLLTPALQEMKVQPEMLLKTRQRKKSQITKKVNMCEARGPASIRF
jgi:hypothetical protein